MALRPSIVLICIMTAALLAVAWWVGILGLLWMSDRVHSIPIIGSTVVLGLCCAWWGKWHSFDTVETALPFLSLFLTGYGVIAVGPALMGGTSYETVRAWLIMALTPNCVMGAGMLWLLALRWRCKPT